MPSPRSLARKSRPASSLHGPPGAAGSPAQLGRGARARVGLQAPDPGRGLELDVDALRAVLEEPRAAVVRRVVAGDEFAQLLVVDASALDARERPGGLD